MKKIVISSALIALLLAGCGTSDATTTPNDKQTQETADATQAQQQETEAAETQVTTEPEQQTEEQTTEEQASTDTSVAQPSKNATTDTAKGAENATTEKVALENKTLTLYASNEDATLIEPFEVTYEGEEENLVPFIFEKVDMYDTNLIDYQFENEGTSLILNIDDSIFNVQGSTGGTIYTSALVQSFLDNFQALNDVTFLYNGSSEPVSDHIAIGEPYGRDDITIIAQ